MVRVADRGVRGGEDAQEGFCAPVNAVSVCVGSAWSERSSTHRQSSLRRSASTRALPSCVRPAPRGASARRLAGLEVNGRTSNSPSTSQTSTGSHVAPSLSVWRSSASRSSTVASAKDSVQVGVRQWTKGRGDAPIKSPLSSPRGTSKRSFCEKLKRLPLRAASGLNAGDSNELAETSSSAGMDEPYSPCGGPGEGSAAVAVAVAAGTSRRGGAHADVRSRSLRGVSASSSRISLRMCVPSGVGGGCTVRGETGESGNGAVRPGDERPPGLGCGCGCGCGCCCSGCSKWSSSSTAFSPRRDASWRQRAESDEAECQWSRGEGALVGDTGEMSGAQLRSCGVEMRSVAILEVASKVSQSGKRSEDERMPGTHQRQSLPPAPASRGTARSVNSLSYCEK